jgi:hypothetical protein
MHDPMPEDEDERLALVFRAAAEPVADDGFSEAVMRRVSRLAWRRRLVLAAAGVTGLAIASQPIWNLSISLGRELVHLGGRWTEFAWVLQSPLVTAAGLLVIAGPSIWQWIEE